MRRGAGQQRGVQGDACLENELPALPKSNKQKKMDDAEKKQEGERKRAGDEAKILGRLFFKEVFLC